jgi:hypothetical protein
VLAGDRGRVDHQRLAVLGAGLLQHRDRLARHQVDAAQVHVELEVELLGLHVGDGRADPDTRVVDQDVEPAAALAVRGHERLDLVLVGHVGGDRLDVDALVAQLLRGSFKLVRTPSRDRHRVVVPSEGPGDGEPDAARPACDQCCARCHGAEGYANRGLRMLLVGVPVASVF